MTSEEQYLYAVICVVDKHVCDSPDDLTYVKHECEDMEDNRDMEL